MPVKMKKSGRKKRKLCGHDPHKVKVLDSTSRKFSGSLSPTNVVEQKQRFFRYGLTPEFEFSKGRHASDIERKMHQSARNAIHTNYFEHAKAILNKVKVEYFDGMRLINEMYGPRISQEEATGIIKDYIKLHDLEGQIAIYWSESITGSAKMCWKGPVARANKPDQRHFSLVIKSTHDNKYLTKVGISCLMNHEIGTHYFRAYNDGFQPWYTDRNKFSLHSYSSRKSVASEEGLACLNTLINANSKYLWGSALCYYTSCMAVELSFEELFDHLELYVSNRDYRWRLCLRVKRALCNTDFTGGIGKDQVYFEGAVNILLNLDTIDLPTMFIGRISYNQTSRAKRIARTDCIRLPIFMRNLERYKFMLKYIAYVNGLGEKPCLHVAVPTRRIHSAQFDYEAHRQKRDGKIRRTVSDLPPEPQFMCFSETDAPVPPVPCRPATAQSATSRSVRAPTVVQSTHKNFLYPTSPVPEIHYVRVRNMLYPEMHLDLSKPSGVDNYELMSNSVTERALGREVLPDIVPLTDRKWHKR